MDQTGLWTAFTALVLASIFAYFMPAAAFDGAITPITVFFGLLVTGIIPTMVLAATILRPEHKTHSELVKISEALNKQLTFFQSLFSFACIGTLALLAGSLFEWKLITPEISVIGVPEIDLSKTYSWITALAILILVLRAPQFLSGLRSLLNLHTASILNESLADLREQVYEIKSAADEPTHANHHRCVEELPNKGET